MDTKEDKHRMKIFRRMQAEKSVLQKIAMAFLLLLAFHLPTANAEFGDVVINNYSDEAGVRPVVFPHWFHRIRFNCKTCHADLGFKFKAGGNQINMLKIINGDYCGACHNGEKAWALENCELCHTGKPGEKTQVHNSTQSLLVAPAPADNSKKK